MSELSMHRPGNPLSEVGRPWRDRGALSIILNDHMAERRNHFRDTDLCDAFRVRFDLNR